MIAISYRRQDSSPTAGRLYDRLQAEFGKDSVFMDFDSIPYGVDFREHIKQTLQRAKVVVAIIGPEWLGEDAKSGRRIDDPTDFVRLEIASALQQGIPVIPILVNNTPMPEAKTLPPDMEGLAFRNGLVLDTGIDFHHHADRLIAGIHKVVSKPLPPAVIDVPRKESPPGRAKFSAAGTILVIALAILAGIALWYFGSHSPKKAFPLENAAPPQKTESAVPVRNAEFPAEVLGEWTYQGKVGPYEAVFSLRFEPGGRVTGTYVMPLVNKNLVLRLEGRNPKGRLLLDEYTHDRLSAHIDLTLKDSASDIRWEGTMYNTPPDNRVFPVSFGRTRP
jgi:hypothetical protein